jgi:murein DD-endopeptidase MepM/ murein hydrolase activator NlpD
VHRNFPLGRTGRVRSAVGLGLVLPLLVTAFVLPAPSSADEDDLKHRRHSVQNQIEDQKVDVDEISADLVKAQARVDAGVKALAAAQSRLADLRIQVQAAIERDQEMQKQLDAAIVRLENARADLLRGKQEVAEQRSELATFALSTYQGGGLSTLSLGLGLNSQTTQDAVDTFQGLDAVGNKAGVELQQLQASEVILTLTEERVEKTRDEVRKSRIAAAENLATKQDLEAQAATAEQEVRRQVASLRVERASVAAAKRTEVSRLNNLEAERNRIQDQLQKIAERRARQNHSSINNAPTNGGGYLSYPVNNTYITSPYGMRLHPILHVWKLHDGTDFHAACGTPVYAAASGRIISEYYNAGYGNRVIIDHGYVKGVSLSTSYNHLTSFVKGVGSSVQRGELIAYSGTTGYSTACHLHFMVYVNGATTNPMNWL